MTVTAFPGGAGLLSDRARELARREGSLIGSIFKRMGSLLPLAGMHRPVVAQAELRQGWDRLDYRADGFEPFAFIGDYVVYTKESDGLLEFVVVAGGVPEDVFELLERTACRLRDVPEGAKALPSPAVALMVLLYQAAVCDDHELDRDEKTVLGVVSDLLGLSGRDVEQVRSMVMVRTVLRLLDDLRLDEGEEELVEHVSKVLGIDDGKLESEKTRAVVARAAVLARELRCDGEAAVDEWVELARRNGLDPRRIASMKRVLERARFRACCKEGNLPVVQSSYVPLGDGELLHFSARAAMYGPGRDSQRLVVRKTVIGGETALSMMLDDGDDSSFAVGKARFLQCGWIYVTSERLRFHGEKRPFVRPLSRLGEVTRFDDGLLVDPGDGGPRRLFRFDGADIALILMQELGARKRKKQT